MKFIPIVRLILMMKINLELIIDDENVNKVYAYYEISTDNENEHRAYH